MSESQQIQKNESPLRELQLGEVFFLIKNSFGILALSAIQPFVCLPRLMSLVDPGKTRQTPQTLSAERAATLIKGLLRFIYRDRYCVKQSLLLFRYLKKSREDVALYFGVSKHGDHLSGHAWVELEGVPIAEENDPRKSFRVTYSYPAIFSSQAR